MSPMEIVIALSAILCTVLVSYIFHLKNRKSNLDTLKIDELVGKRIIGVSIEASEDMKVKRIRIYCHDLTHLILQEDSEGLIGFVFDVARENKEPLIHTDRLKSKCVTAKFVWYDDDKTEEKEFSNLFHKLWSRDVGTSGYNKSEWQRLGALTSNAGLWRS